MRISLFEGLGDNVPKHRQCTWSDLVESCAEHERRDTREGPLWCPAEYRRGGKRNDEDVERIWLYVADLDDVPEAELSALIDKLDGLRWLLYSTYKHGLKPGTCRARIVLDLSRPALPEEWPTIWGTITALLGVREQDETCKNPSRFYFTPSARLPTEADPAPVLFDHRDGTPLDVDEVLATATEVRASVRRSPVKRKGKNPKAGRFAGLKDAGKRTVGVGGRNARLTSEAGKLRALGLGEAAMLERLRELNLEICDPPLLDDEIAAIAGSIANYEPKRRYPLTEIGNGERVHDRFGERYRWVRLWNRFIVWNERRWSVEGADVAMERFAKNVVRTEIAVEAATCEDPDQKKLLGAWVKHSSKASTIRATVSLAKSEQAAVSHTVFDRDRFVLNCPNGTLDLTTLDLKQHDPRDLLTQMTGTPWVPGASEGSEWERFVLEVSGGEVELAEYLRRLAGYCATGDTSEHALFFLYGLGANGKSVFIRTLMAALGEYARAGAPNLLLANKNGNDRHPTEVASLWKRRLVSVQEVEEGRAWNESLVKQLTGSDVLSTRRMNEDFWDLEATHKLLVTGNSKPVVRESSDGIWRRLKLVPFEVSFRGREDRDLQERLLANLPAVLDWCVRGAVEWQEIGLAEPQCVLAATEEYRREQDDVGYWLEECCDVHPNAECSRQAATSSYATWSDAQGEKFPLTPRRLASKLRERGMTDKSVGSRGLRGWLGFAPRKGDHLRLVRPG